MHGGSNADEVRESETLHRYQRQAYRNELNKIDAERKVEESTRQIVASGEFRATAAGDFAIPQWMLDKYASALSSAGTLAAQGTQGQLPEFGLEILVPTITTGPEVISQSQNSSVTSRDMVDTTMSGSGVNVVTLAAAITLSNQLLDRSPIRVDEVFARNAAIQATTKLDTLVVAAVVAAAAQTITDSGSASFSAILTDLNQAAADVTVGSSSAYAALYATHAFFPSLNARWLLAQVDSQSRPIFVPEAGGSMARAARYGAKNTGYLGYDLSGLQLFANDNIAANGSDAQVIVGAVEDALLVLTDLPIVDVWPQSYASQLSYEATWRQYAAWQVVFQAVSR